MSWFREHRRRILGGTGFDFATGLVGYWKLDTDSNDSSGNSHHGNDTSMVYSGGYANFKPGFIDINDSDDFSFTDGFGNDIPFSILFPFYFESNLNYQHLINKRLDAVNTEYQVFKGTSDVRMNVMGVNGSYLQVSISGAFVSINSFHVGLFTYDGSKNKSGMIAYCDGIDRSDNRAQGGIYNGMTNTSSVLKFGSRFTESAVSMYDGKSKEVAFWKNRVITPEEAIELDYRVRNGISLI